MYLNTELLQKPKKNFLTTSWNISVRNRGTPYLKNHVFSHGSYCNVGFSEVELGMDLCLYFSHKCVQLMFFRLKSGHISSELFQSVLYLYMDGSMLGGIVNISMDASRHVFRWIRWWPRDNRRGRRLLHRCEGSGDYVPICQILPGRISQVFYWRISIRQKCRKQPPGWGKSCNVQLATMSPQRHPLWSSVELV